MATSYTLRFDRVGANRAAMGFAFRLVTDTTRRVYNRAIVLTPVDTGTLRAQNKMRVARKTHAVVGEVFNETAYAMAVHDGSKRRVIRPRRKKALRFVAKSGDVVIRRKVTIPARRGRPWLYRALIEIAQPAGFRITRP